MRRITGIAKRGTATFTICASLASSLPVALLSGCTDIENAVSDITETVSGAAQETEEERDDRPRVSIQAAEAINSRFQQLKTPVDLFDQMKERENDWKISLEKSASYDLLERSESTGNATEYEYDASGQLVKETEYASGSVRMETSYSYDGDETTEDVKRFSGSAAEKYPELITVTSKSTDNRYDEVTTTLDGEEVSSFRWMPREGSSEIMYQRSLSGTLTNHYQYLDVDGGSVVKHDIYDGEGTEGTPRPSRTGRAPRARRAGRRRPGGTGWLRRACSGGAAPRAARDSHPSPAPCWRTARSRWRPGSISSG